MNTPDSRVARRGPWLVALGAGALWALCHVAIHSPRPWPSWELGEWDVLLVLEAIRRGQQVDLAVGAIHGHELGSYLLALLLHPLRALGLSTLMTAKVGATAVGAFATAAAAAAAWELRERRGDRRGAWLAGALVAVVASVSWPSWHRELAGVFGRTPESALPTLLAAILLFLPSSGGSPSGVSGVSPSSGDLLSGGKAPEPSPRRLIVVGFLLGVGWMFSPAATWMLGVAGLAVMVPRAPWTGAIWSRDLVPRALRRLLLLAVGIALPVVLTALLLPGGGEGVSAFLAKQVNQTAEALGGHTGTHPNSSAERGPLRSLFAMPAILADTSSSYQVAASTGAMKLLGWCILGTCAFGLVSDVRRRRWSPEASLSLAALSFSIPLGLVAVGSGDLGNAARYYVVPIYLSLIASSSWLVALPARSSGRPRGAGLVPIAVLFLALVPLPTLGSMVTSPSWTLEESLMNTGAHGLPRVDGRDRHFAFRTLRAGVPIPGRLAFAEGYGTDLGSDAAFALWDRQTAPLGWPDLLPQLDRAERRSLLVGVGCGYTRVPLAEETLRSFGLRPEDEQRDLLYGFARCLYAPLHGGGPSVAAPPDQTPSGLTDLSVIAVAQFEEGRSDALSSVPVSGRSSVRDPAERMRQLPPLGPRPAPRPEPMQ